MWRHTRLPHLVHSNLQPSLKSISAGRYRHPLTQYLYKAVLHLRTRWPCLFLGHPLTAYSLLDISQLPELDLMAPAPIAEEALDCLATKLDGVTDGNLGQELRRLLQDETTLDDVCFRCFRNRLR
jgi:hypothetical protein